MTDDAGTDGARPGVRGLWAAFGSHRRMVAGLAAGSVVAAQTEALALVLVVPLAQALAEGRPSVDGDLGPASVSMSVGSLMVVAASLLCVALVVNVALVWQRGRAVARWQFEQRQALVEAWLDATWALQASTRDGFLHALTTYVGRGGIALVRLAELVRAIVTLGVFLATSMVLGPLTAVVMVAMGTVFFVALRPVSSRLRAGGKAIGERGITYNQELQEIAATARDIRVFDARDAVVGDLGALVQDLERRQARQALLLGATQPAYQFGGMLVALGAVALAAELHPTDVATVGAIALLLIRSVSYAQAAQSTYHQLVETAPYVEILRDEQRRLAAEREDFGDQAPDTITALRLEGVSYRYPSAGEAADSLALDGVDLELRRGEIVGIAGRSGSGKSTLAQIVLRLRAPTAGRVLADGVPVGDIEPRRWAQLVTLVPQDVALVHGTLRDNVVFHDRGLADAAVEAAVRAAALTEVVASLPDGLATPVGASTRDLSGGQVQRVGLARALVRDPAVLVLDEPTSALDERSEAALHRSLSELGRDRIVLVIAHRRTTLAMCDRLVVLADGRVVRDGPRAEVLADDLLETGLLELDRNASEEVADGR